MLKKFGYTYKERKKIINDLSAKGIGRINGEYHKGTKQQERLLAIFDCIEMVESLFAYGHFEDSTDQLLKNRYLKSHIKKLNENTVRKIIDEQRKLIKNIKENVYVASDGSSYNSLTFIDD